MGRGGVPRGEYAVAIRYKAACGMDDPMDFEMIIRLDGEVFRYHPDTLAEDERLEVARFDC